MAVVLKNAVLLDLDPIQVRRGQLRFDGGVITAVGEDVGAVGDTAVDCHDCVVLPGLVNGHTHLYSALAVGMPPPPRNPRNFHEILELIWWRLDRALDAESVEVSGRVGALDALNCGTTTLIDHHASPNFISGSLDALERGIADVGLRAVLCYETTDRNGLAGAKAGIEENRRYLARCAARTDHRFAAMAGAHACFTMSDESLAATAELARTFATGVHIHIAEDPCDDRICRERYGRPLVERLTRAGIVAPETILAHCTHLADDAARELSTAVAGIAHNPRSNMNNQVGYAPTGALRNLQLGTDGIGADMWTEAKHAWFKARDERVNIAPDAVVGMLAHSARVAGRRLGCALGRLAPGAVADIVVTRYRPFTELTADNAASHFIFAMGPQHVRHVALDGQWLLWDGQGTLLEDAAVRSRAQTVSSTLWSRMAGL